MINMPHCRFENTYKALQECLEILADGTDGLNEYEQQYRPKLIKLCLNIADDFGDECHD